jgi:prevent-host-death family protein
MAQQADIIVRMTTVPLDQAQQHLAALIKRVEAGEHVLITHNDRPVAELRPVADSGRVRRPHGLAAGKFVVPADFDAPLPEGVLKPFEER